jgi:choline kinase
MKALILASREGKRLRPLTYTLPKPLLKILEDKTILDYQMENLIGCGIRDILITTGPFEDALKAYVEKHFPAINVAYVHNPRYETTNYLYSLWLTKERIDDDVILVHGDLLFDKKLLERLIAENGNRVLVNKKIAVPEKDFKAVVEHNTVIRIGVDFSGENAFFSAPLYKFSKSDFLCWLDEIEEFVKRRDTTRYAEDAFNEISDTIVLRPVYFDDELCMEVDTMEDLEIARDIIRVKS